MLDIVLAQYCDYLREKLEITETSVNELLEKDEENQISTFLLKTVDHMNQASIQEAEV